MIKNLLLTITLLFSISFATEIYFGNVDHNGGTAEVMYTTTEEIGGFQFQLSGGTITGASGGEADAAGFTVQIGGGTVLGF